MTAITNTKRGLASLGIAGLVITGLGVAATADVGPDQPTAPEEGSLTIHKYAGSPIGAHDGTELVGGELDGFEALVGVEFTIQRVGVIEADVCVELDLTDPEAWESVPTTGVPDFGATEGDLCASGTPVVVTTGADGSVTEVLDLGLYYVTETGYGDNPIVEPAAPFYVTIPLPTVVAAPVEYDWNYDVHVYPKNQLLGTPEKEITDAPDGFTVGSNVTWELGMTIPTLNEDDFTEASITDALADELTYVSSIVRIGDEIVYDDTNGTDTLGLVTIDVDEVEWTFTALGLAELDANQGERLTVELVTAVNTGAGEITNGGDDIDNGASFSFNNTPRSTPEAYTYWGQLEITKVDQSDTTRTLVGAEFAVYAAAPGAVDCPAVPAGDEVSTGVSGVDGVVTWTHADGVERSPLNLWVANSNTQRVDPTKVYCVYETKAPAGYTATGPELVTVTAGALTEAGELAWQNDQREGPDMPLTGAGGTLLLTVGGLVLIGAGVASVIVTSKRRQNQSV